MAGGGELQREEIMGFFFFYMREIKVIGPPFCPSDAWIKVVPLWSSGETSKWMRAELFF